jgi:hypothetical protein
MTKACLLLCFHFVFSSHTMAVKLPPHWFLCHPASVFIYLHNSYTSHFSSGRWSRSSLLSQYAICPRTICATHFVPLPLCRPVSWLHTACKFYAIPFVFLQYELFENDYLGKTHKFQMLNAHWDCNV